MTALYSPIQSAAIAVGVNQAILSVIYRSIIECITFKVGPVLSRQTIVHTQRALLLDYRVFNFQNQTSAQQTDGRTYLTCALQFDYLVYHFQKGTSAEQTGGGTDIVCSIIKIRFHCFCIQSYLEQLYSDFQVILHFTYHT